MKLTYAKKHYPTIISTIVIVVVVIAIVLEVKDSHDYCLMLFSK